MTTWHVIVNGDGVVLALYGAALRGEAEAKLTELRALNPDPRLLTVRRRRRPRVGAMIRRRAA